MSQYTLHLYDLPDELKLQGSLALDTEAMGLNNLRDRLCMVQLCDETGAVHLVHFPTADYRAPNLRALLHEQRLCLFHFARFDVALLYHTFGILCENVYCTRTASRLVRTYTDKHGLKDLCKELLNVDLSKQQQISDWGSDQLSPEQLHYAASDVIYLHQLKTGMDARLQRENRTELARYAMQCLPARAMLDIHGFADVDIFAHS